MSDEARNETTDTLDAQASTQPPGEEAAAAGASKEPSHAVGAAPEKLSDREMEGIPNFRDLGYVSSKIKRNTIYRSGEPSRASQNDTEWLISTIGLVTIVDLREAGEAGDDKGDCLLSLQFRGSGGSMTDRSAAASPIHSDVEDIEEDVFEEEDSLCALPQAQSCPIDPPPEPGLRVRGRTSSASRARSASPRSRRRGSTSSHDGEASFAHRRTQSASHAGGESRRRMTIAAAVAKVRGRLASARRRGAAQHTRTLHRAPLAAKGTMGKVLFGMITTREKLRVAGKYLLGQVWSHHEEEAKCHMLRVFNGLGLVGLYRIILENNGKTLCRVLKILASRSNHPALVHCSHGKDRTGIVVALTLSICGVDRQVIIDDYHRSEAHGMSEEGRMRFETIRELDVEEWCRAPKEVMEKTLTFIDVQFGGLDQYLDSIGFDATWRARMVETVCVAPASSQP